MNLDLDKNTPRLLGAAFLLQASATLVGGLIWLSLIGTGTITDSMTNISNNEWLIRASIVSQMIGAIGIVMLGVLLYLTLKKQNVKIAFIALGLYLVEVAALVASQIAVVALLRISQESVIKGHPEYLQTLGTLFLEVHDFASGSVHMLFFAVGATLFYYLFYKSGYLPKGFALLGLIAAPLAVLGVLFVLFGVDVPIIVFLPNAPFEFGVGLWLLFKGIRDGSETK